MDKIVTWIKLTWAALIAAPIIAPLLDLLHHRSVLVLLAGFVGYTIVPQIQGLSPAWRDNLGQFVFFGTLLLSGRFTIEGLMQARAGLPTTMEDYLRALLTELISPTPDSVSIGAVKYAPPLATVGVMPEDQLVRSPRRMLPPEEQADAG